jgi:hypothetical protein
MLTASTPGAPPLARTFFHASYTRRLGISNDLHFGLGVSVGSFPAGLASDRPWSARPLRSSPITGPSPLLRAGPSLCPASVLCRSRIQPLAVLPLDARRRQYRDDRFSCSMPAPTTSSRHLYTGHRQDDKQAASWLRARPTGAPLSREAPPIPVLMPNLGDFDASAVVHTRSSSRRTPDPVTPGLFHSRFPHRLLTGMTLRRFGIPACTANPEGLPPSLAQHGHAGDLLHRHHFPSGHTESRTQIICPYRRGMMRQRSDPREDAASGAAHHRSECNQELR